jgi:hypothetical protein
VRESPWPRAANGDEDAGRQNVARAFSVEVGLDAARVGACATNNRVFNRAVRVVRKEVGP